MKKLRVLVLLHAEQMPPDSKEGYTPEEIQEWKMEYDVLRTLRKLGHEVQPLAVKDELLPIRQAIDEWEPHVTFNLLADFHDVGAYDAYIASYLELLKAAFTGCNQDDRY